MATTALQYPEDYREQRAEDRRKVRFGAILEADYGGEVSSTILDVSTAGLLIETEQALVVGLKMFVQLPGQIKKACMIKWSSGRFFGATFAEPLSKEEVRELAGLNKVVCLPFVEHDFATKSRNSATSNCELGSKYQTEEEDRLSPPAKIVVMLGLSGALWAVILASAWLVFA